MQIKEKQITLVVSESKKVSDIIVAVTIPFAGISSGCLKRLKFNYTDSTELVDGSESAAIAFALFETVRDKLTGSGLEIFKNKISNITCYSLDNSFTITWNTQGTGTSLRKTVGIMLSCLNTSKLFTKYSENIKFLSNSGGKKEQFNGLSKKFIESIKKSIDVTAVGKINMVMAKLKDIGDALVSKLPEMDIASVKDIAPLPKHAVVASVPYPVILSKGIETAIVADYIRNTSNGMAVDITDEGVVIYNYDFEIKHRQIKDAARIKDYIHKKYKKLEDKEELSAIFAYFSLAQGFVTATTAKKLVATKLKASELRDLLLKAMK